MGGGGEGGGAEGRGEAGRTHDARRNTNQRLFARLVHTHGKTEPLFPQPGKLRRSEPELRDLSASGLQADHHLSSSTRQQSTYSKYTILRISSCGWREKTFYGICHGRHRTSIKTRNRGNVSYRGRVAGCGGCWGRGGGGGGIKIFLGRSTDQHRDQVDDYPGERV